MVNPDGHLRHVPNYRCGPTQPAVLLTPLVYEATAATSGAWDPAASISAYSAAARSGYNLDHLQLLLLKGALVSPLIFHTCNGFRHIGWDQWAKGIRHLEDVYKSGNIVLAATLILSALFTIAHW